MKIQKFILLLNLNQMLSIDNYRSKWCWFKPLRVNELNFEYDICWTEDLLIALQRERVYDKCKTGNRLSFMWEETRVLREKPVKASECHSLSHTNELWLWESNMGHSGEKRLHYPLRYSFIIDLVCTVNFKFLGHSRMLKPYF